MSPLPTLGLPFSPFYVHETSFDFDRYDYVI